MKCGCISKEKQCTSEGCLAICSSMHRYGGVHIFVKRHTYELLMDRLSDRYVCEKTGLPLDVVRAAFRDLATDPFVHLTADEEQFRISRVY